MNENQVNAIANGISLFDVYEYIKNHTLEYNKYLSETKDKEPNDNYSRIIDEIISSGKIEVQIKWTSFWLLYISKLYK